MSSAPQPALPTFPAPLAHARLAYTREDSLSPHRAVVGQQGSGSSLRGRGQARGVSIVRGSRERSVSTSGRSDWTAGGSEGWEPSERGRSVSGSRAPLFRPPGGVGRSLSRVREKGEDAAGEGGGGEKAVKKEEGREEKQSWASWTARLARHLLGVRGPRALTPPFLPFLRHLPLSGETPLLTFLGAFPSILLCCAISAGLASDHEGTFDATPLTVGSLGATAVLLYAVPEGPLSQPRNLVGGHMISALVGCIISQLFSLSSRFTDTHTSVDNQLASASSWYSLTPVAAALAVALATTAMQLTGTIHPPGGATALIAAYHQTTRPRWTFLLVIFLSVSVMGAWALVVNNLGRRRYPAYWWSPPAPDAGPAKGAPSPALSRSATHPHPPPPPSDSSSSGSGEHDKPHHSHREHASPSSYFASPTPAGEGGSGLPEFSPERDLQQRWLGRLGEEDEEAVAGLEPGSLAFDGEEGTGKRGEAWEEEEERGRRATRR
ncbi:hypothetical protein JCM8097_004328 [Rhodosporidiobolus ruineniae]